MYKSYTCTGGNIPFLIPGCNNLNILSFFLGLARFVNFVELFKEPTFGFIDFLYCFLCFYS